MINKVYQANIFSPLVVISGKGVRMKLRVDAAVHGLSENYLRRKIGLHFTYEFHTWIKGRIEMESIIPPPLSFALPLPLPSPISLSLSLSLSFPLSHFLLDDDAVPPRVY